MDQKQQLPSSLQLCIKSSIEKFQKWPNNFFTESDAHAYLYYYFFRFGSRDLKKLYSTKDPKVKTVLIHREYPTTFRYHRSTMELDEARGGRGLSDLVVLNPEFVANHSLEEVMAKDYRTYCKDEKHQLLAAIEFKLIVKPLDKKMEKEIEKDFKKLTWAIESGQVDDVYLIIFNRARKEERFVQDLRGLKMRYLKVKGVYLESIVSSKERYYEIIYLNDEDWKYKIRYKV